jgi:tRNA threonylcarbamoyladenosine biosynthesis protein TsaB
VTLLGFDTATRATAVALWSPGGPTHEARDDPPRGSRPRHTSRLMPLIVELFEETQLGWNDVEAIAVGIGPGTFTGLRIGIATARALARARGLPLVGISTLESLALGGIDAAAGQRSVDELARANVDAVVAVVDARRGEVFAAAYTPDRTRVLEPCAIAPEALGERLSALGSHVLAVGDGAVEFKGVLEGSGALVAEDLSDINRVTAINHCRLANGRPPSPPDEVHPEYLRLPDAEIARRAANSP